MKDGMIVFWLIVAVIAMGVTLMGCSKNNGTINLEKILSGQTTFEEEGLTEQQITQVIESWNCNEYNTTEACNEAKPGLYAKAIVTENKQVKEVVQKMKLDEDVPLCKSNADCPSTERCLTMCHYKDKIKDMIRVCAFDKVDNIFLFSLTDEGVCSEFFNR